jgi:hypothetical protein
MGNDKNRSYDFSGRNSQELHPQNLESFLNKDADIEARNSNYDLRDSDSRRSHEDDRGVDTRNLGATHYHNVTNNDIDNDENDFSRHL